MWPNPFLMVPAGVIALLSGVLLGWTLLETSRSPSIASASLYRSAPTPRETAIAVAVDHKPVEAAIEQAPQEPKVFPTPKKRKKIVSRNGQPTTGRRFADDDDDDDED